MNFKIRLSWKTLFLISGILLLISFYIRKLDLLIEYPLWFISSLLFIAGLRNIEKAWSQRNISRAMSIEKITSKIIGLFALSYSILFFVSFNAARYHIIFPDFFSPLRDFFLDLPGVLYLFLGFIFKLESVAVTYVIMFLPVFLYIIIASKNVKKIDKIDRIILILNIIFVITNLIIL